MSTPPAPFGASLRAQFLIEEGITFLNHGSYGATPRPVLEAQDAWRRRLEAEPVRFMQRELPALLRQAAAKLAAFMGARARDMVFVENATAGANAVLRSLTLGPGDEILMTDHGYGAVRNVILHVCRLSGAKLVEVPLPVPSAGDLEIVAAVRGLLSARTKLAVFDLITSPTALVLPVAALAAAARDAGASVLIDAAHGPGQLRLDVGALGADWVVGNAHKWLFAPKGTGFLWAEEGAQRDLHPPVISHGLDKGFTAEFDWVGTRDPSAWLASGVGLDFWHQAGAERLMERNRDLAAAAADDLSLIWDSPISGPPALRAAMATIRLPERLQPAPAGLHETRAKIQDRLFHEHHIEVPIIAFKGALWLRLSAQIYNEAEDYPRLARALAE